MRRHRPFIIPLGCHFTVPLNTDEQPSGIDYQVNAASKFVKRCDIKKAPDKGLLKSFQATCGLITHIHVITAGLHDMHIRPVERSDTEGFEMSWVVCLDF